MQLPRHFPQIVFMTRIAGFEHRRGTFSYSSGGVRLWYTTVGFSPASDIARRKPLRVYLNEGAADSSACAAPAQLSDCAPAWLTNYARPSYCAYKLCQAVILRNTGGKSKSEQVGL